MKLLKKILIVLILIVSCFAVGIGLMYLFNKYKTSYTAEDFKIGIIRSNTDFDNDGIDDYTDILEGAKKEAEKHPTYRSAYYAGGYPPDNEGVCTDVIWRALKNAGYDLKDMVDEDIRNNVDKYPRVEGKPDPNIDFRRVPNLKIYFERNHISLTKDINKIEEWQPGDIVVFGKSHIGIISDKRNKNGVPYLIHNAGQPLREEDVLENYNKYQEITGHFRLNDNVNI